MPREAQNPFANTDTPRYRSAGNNQREPHNYNYDLAFISNGMNANASTMKFEAFLFTEMKAIEKQSHREEIMQILSLRLCTSVAK